jgi:hypothetical protein
MNRNFGQSSIPLIKGVPQMPQMQDEELGFEVAEATNVVSERAPDRSNRLP